MPAAILTPLVILATHLSLPASDYAPTTQQCWRIRINARLLADRVGFITVCDGSSYQIRPQNPIHFPNFGMNGILVN